jgi:hypothetical protein
MGFPPGDRKSRTFRLENCLKEKEKLIDSLSGSRPVIFVHTDNCDDTKSCLERSCPLSVQRVTPPSLSPPLVAPACAIRLKQRANDRSRPRPLFTQPIIPIAEAVRQPASQPATRTTTARSRHFRLRIHKFPGVTLGSQLYGRPKKPFTFLAISDLSRDSQIHVLAADTPLCSDPKKTER